MIADRDPGDEDDGLSRRLEATTRVYGDAMYARMQEPGFEEAMQRAFSAAPEEIAAAATAAWQKRTA